MDRKFAVLVCVWLVEMARSSQEQQQIAAVMAARDNMALYQIYQRYAHDPALLQRQLSAYLAKSPHDSDVARMTDASHLVYHFASKITRFIQITSACVRLSEIRGDAL